MTLRRYISTQPRFLARLLVLSVFSLISACSSSPKISPAVDYGHVFAPANSAALKDSSQALDLLYQQHDVWQGTPYRLGGQSRTGIDCSAFVQRTYRDLFGIALPRTTEQQVYVGNTIAKSELRAGDLVFFRNGNHVGIYLEQDKFLHASTRLGVTISSMENIYWSRKYWRSIRVRPYQPGS